MEIIQVKGWDYLALIEAYEKAATLARTEHVPVMVHVTELTQPLGHSSSGSHERYKSKERLEWEKAYDCNLKMREWILKEGLAKEAELIKMEEAALKQVRAAKRASWEAYQAPIFKQKAKLLSYLPILKKETHNDPKIQIIFSKVEQVLELGFKDVISAARQIKIVLSKHPNAKLRDFDQWLDALTSDMKTKSRLTLYTVSKDELINFKAVKPKYNKDAETVDGRIIIRDNFEALLNKHDSLLFFGEDVGKIGDVNHGLEGLQAKFSELRIADTGIREATIVGQGIGLALRGLRPIAEIQYLDYILYCIQILSDDLATLNYRTLGKQIAPLIIRTRGHRLEGIWHSGSPMGGMIHLLRGIHLLVPRNMTQAAGFYNTLLQIEQPAIVVESLNGYSVKETLPLI